MKFAAIAAVLLTPNSCHALTSIQRPQNACSSRPAYRSISLAICRYANDDYTGSNGLQDVIKRRRPRRAMPHIQTASRAEEATMAGYIIRRDHVFREVDGADGDGRRVRPLRVIRRIVLRGGGRRERLRDESSGPVSEETLHEHEFDCDELTEEVMVELRYGSKHRTQTTPRVPRLSHSPNRVTFKSTRQASHSLQSLGFVSSASLTDYMMQPVEKYSLLSFHDEEPNDTTSSAKARRWLVRRLTANEAQRYINKSTNLVNLFRLAVPLQPLIGWDLTPVIDLEVIPPDLSENESDYNEQHDRNLYQKSSKWSLKGIRGRGGNPYNSNKGQLSVVKIRSLSVSLLSTQEEVNKAMLDKNLGSRRRSTHQRSSSKMQEEALGMVGKVEEWLKPHITFEAELSWNDGARGVFVDDKISNSTVTAKATAITSLTIPKISSGILRAAVPSAFLIKRLGTTLTSKALEICLPRFLRQLERDYVRWTGVDQTSSNKVRR
jgi:hypothetical protein